MSSLGIVEETHHDRSQGSAWQWWLAALMALVAAGFGAYGLWIYELAHGNRVDPASVGYHTLQLFVLHAPHLDPPVPWQLNLGRWLSALVVLGSVGLLAVFRSKCSLFWARFRRGHIVICGLGRLGLRLAQEFRRSGVRVVAIESNGAPGPIGTARDAGVAVITGDACSPLNLRRAAVDRASRIIAVCDDEQKNVAIAAAIGEMLAHGTKGRRGIRESTRQAMGHRAFSGDSVYSHNDPAVTWRYCRPGVAESGFAFGDVFTYYRFVLG